MVPTPLVPVVDEVWRWSEWNAPRQLWFNGHALRLADAFVLVDPVAMSEDVVDALRQAAGPAASWLCVITNRDHVRAAAQARALFDARILVPAADAAAIDLRADEELVEGLPIGGELTTVAVADGKSPGELALSWLSRRLVILGDAAVGKAGGLAMLADDKFADVAAARRGVARLAALAPEIILVGDGDDLMSGGSAALEALGAGPAHGPKPAPGARGC
jgi:glyoxylase-like metal-dependent hydrolase (beta-lactamase superfamily II)